MRSVSEPKTAEDSGVLCEPLRHLHTPAPVLWCQLLTSLYPVWIRRSSRRIVFSEVRFSSSLELGALQTSPGYPGRTAARPAGGPPLSGPSEVCRCPVRFLRNSLAPWSSPICWWWHYLVPGESFCDPSRVFGQAVGGTRQTICWKCTFPRKTPYPHPEVSQILLFCIYPFCHVLIYRYQYDALIGDGRAGEEAPSFEGGVHVRTCRCTPHLTCVSLSSNGLLATHQVWTQSAQPFARYGRGVCTCARADALHLRHV